MDLRGMVERLYSLFLFFQAEDGIRDGHVTGVQTCALPISTLYYDPVPESPANLALMRLIDQHYLEKPYLGSRRMTLWLRDQQHQVNRKRVQRLIDRKSVV